MSRYEKHSARVGADANRREHTSLADGDCEDGTVRCMSMVSTALATALQSLPPTVMSMVSLAAGTSPTQPPFSGVDILGFYITAGESTEVWLVTPGRLMRAEVSSTAALVVTFPIERVSRVSELYAAEGYQVTMEVDAEARVVTAPGREELAKYVIVAQEVTAMSDLQEFCRQLRLALGT